LDQQLGGHPDSDIATVCIDESRVLLTLDTDFANILVYPPEQHAGIVLLRTQNQAKPTLIPLVQRLLDALATESPMGRLWIVEPDRIRIRGDD
jgi:predicted nuclease of predicted toxin-antitoxin system